MSTIDRRRFLALGSLTSLAAWLPAAAACANPEAGGVLSAPSQAASAGYEHLLFNDDFTTTDTIDLQRTGRSGFNWYLDRLKGWKPLSAQEIKVEDSVLTLTQRESHVNVGLSTMCSVSGNGTSYKHGYFEARMKFDPSQRSDRGTPSFWSLSTDAFLGKNPNRWAELDFYETIAGAYNGSVHDWTLDSEGRKHDRLNTRTNYALLPGVDFNEWHTYGCLWRPGQVDYYFDGRLVLTTRYSENEVPPENPQHPAGTFSILEQEKNGLTVILGSGDDYPMHVDWVRIWGPGTMTANRIDFTANSATAMLPYVADFEASDTNWFTGDNGAKISLDKAQRHGGNTSLRVEHAGAASSAASVHVIGNISDGHPIKVSFWHKGNRNGSIRGLVHFLGAENQYLGNTSDDLHTCNEQWQQYAFTANVPSGTTNLFLAVDRSGHSGAGDIVWIDDVAISQ